MKIMYSPIPSNLENCTKSELQKIATEYGFPSYKTKPQLIEYISSIPITISTVKEGEQFLNETRKEYLASLTSSLLKQVPKYQSHLIKKFEEYHRLNIKQFISNKTKTRDYRIQLSVKNHIIEEILKAVIENEIQKHQFKTISIIQAYKKESYYLDSITNFLFDKNKRVVGKWVDEKVYSLCLNDIRFCRYHNLNYFDTDNYEGKESKDEGTEGDEVRSNEPLLIHLID
jgi:hypothetical protein